MNKNVHKKIISADNLSLQCDLRRTLKVHSAWLVLLPENDEELIKAFIREIARPRRELPNGLIWSEGKPCQTDDWSRGFPKSTTLIPTKSLILDFNVFYPWSGALNQAEIRLVYVVLGGWPYKIWDEMWNANFRCKRWKAPLGKSSRRDEGAVHHLQL